MSKVTKNITVLPGDGIGPEIVAQAQKVLQAVSEKYGVNFEFTEGLIGAAAIDATGEALPADTVTACQQADAVLLGAVGDPKFDNDPNAKVRPEQGLLAIRKALGLFTNIRPIRTFNALLDQAPIKPERLEGADFVIYRELTGGIYFGAKGKEGEDKAYDHCVYERSEIERIAHLAFKAATQRRNKLTLVDKANVLETSRLWRKVVQEMSVEYPSVEVDYLFVDNAAMQVILNPKQFDVVLTENMFGDIISDEASIISGSLGMLPSASVGTGSSLFEPIHGSYPQAAGKNIANPMATILSVAMMLDHLELFDAAEDVRKAVDFALDEGFATEDVNKAAPQSTTAVGDFIAAQIKDTVSA
ncbi:3-isopropylmalate dehydrogenase [Persicobacter sp. CCB-QB2]|uniref:3-isopropylmalate dehydrogenase n=1 Tax=Persicobacter sp. CCB-QB2 TaxID=1561025 RepID=UPI0006A9AFCA|nr:3-isopropylmalate dehydrogenase [Persicobacter sp. CCB-QB2]